MARVRIDCMMGIVESERQEGSTIFIPTVDMRIWVDGRCTAWTWDAQRPTLWSLLVGPHPMRLLP